MDGKKGDHVILSPAYIVTASDLEMIVNRAAAVIEDFFNGPEFIAAKDGSGKHS